MDGSRRRLEAERGLKFLSVLGPLASGTAARLIGLIVSGPEVANLSSAPVLLEVTSRTPVILSLPLSLAEPSPRNRSPWNESRTLLNRTSSPFSPLILSVLLFSVFKKKKKICSFGRCVTARWLSGSKARWRIVYIYVCIDNWNVHAKDGSRTDGRAWKQVSLVKIDEGGRRVFFQFFFFHLLLLHLHLRVEKTRRRRRRAGEKERWTVSVVDEERFEI